MELFRLVGSIFVDNDKANASISKTDEKAESLGKKFLNGVTTVGKWGAAIAGASAVVGAAMLSVANSSAAAMDEIDKGSAKIGISKKGYQEWAYVLGQNGMEIDKLQVGVKTLVTQMDSAASGSKNAQEAFSKLGVSIYDANGKLKDQETMLNETLFALASMENGTEKARLATQLFGKAGVEMMPMLNGGAEGMAELTKRAHELGLVVSDEAVNAGVTFGDTMDDLKLAFGMVATQIGNSLIPVFQSLADWVLEHMPTIVGAINTVKNVVGIVVDYVMQGIDLLKPFVTSFMGEMTALWNQEGKSVFDSIMSVVNTLYEGWKEIFPSLQNLFKTCVSYISQIWNSIGKPVFAFVMDIVEDVFGIFNEYFPMISNIVGEAFDMITRLYNEVLKPIIDAMANYLTNYLLPVWKVIWGGVSGAVKSVFGTIGNLWENTLKPIFNGIIDFVSGVFSGDWGKAWDGVKSIVSGVWNGIKTSIETPLKLARDTVKGIIDTIKGFFNFKISFPKIPLPHFAVKPKGWQIGDLLKGKIPTLDIDWFEKAMDDGMILNKPAIFGAANGKLLGAGEAGSETVVGTASLMNMIQQAVNQSNGTLASIMSKIYELLKDEDRMHNILVKALTDGNFSVELDGREVGRIVRAYA